MHAPSEGKVGETPVEEKTTQSRLVGEAKVCVDKNRYGAGVNSCGDGNFERNGEDMFRHGCAAFKVSEPI